MAVLWEFRAQHIYSLLFVGFPSFRFELLLTDNYVPLILLGSGDIYYC